MNILEKIINNKKKELLLLKEKYSIADLEKSCFFSREIISAKTYISDPLKSGIIAEFKRMSPSKGILNSEADIAYVTQGYASAGASAVSVLTDRLFFGGRTDDLRITRESNLIPVLRKDFIIDEFQIPESKAMGADIILLLASVLDIRDILRFTKITHSLGMEVLLEIHSVQELEKINEDVDIIGVNNRDLGNFQIDINTSLELAGHIPGKFIKISESGISSTASVKTLREAGYSGFLIGELFMITADPVKAFREFAAKILCENA